MTIHPSALNRKLARIDTNGMRFAILILRLTNPTAIAHAERFGRHLSAELRAFRLT
jgi:hypothetical protein